MKTILALCAISILFAAACDSRRGLDQLPLQQLQGETTAYRATSVPVQDGVAKLSPANTTVQFFAASLKKDAKPLQGGFERFIGDIKITEIEKVVSISMEIETQSLWTPQPDLTAKLHRPDILNTQAYPKATFVSTQITDMGGEATITGVLTLLGVSREISFPATVTFDDQGLTMKAEITMNRSEFGMTGGQGVEHLIGIYALIGEPTRRLPTADAAIP